MTWSVTIPGAPPSVNHSYHPVKTRGGNLRFAKHQSVVDYQTSAMLLVRSACPTGWSPPPGYFRIHYSFYLRRDIDCDNAMKALNDAIAAALAIDDKRFLPCVKWKSASAMEPNPRVVVEIGQDE